MTKLKWFALIEALLLCCVVAVFADDLKKSDIPPVPTPGLVTMVDLGAHKCVPCKMMAPIIAELQKEYAGRASILFIDVWENREQAQRLRSFHCPGELSEKKPSPQCPEKSR